MDQDEWVEVLTDRNPRSRHWHFMSEADRKVYDELPDMVTIYRGVDVGGNPDGLSWTLDKERAEWFARRFHGYGTLLTYTIQKVAIMAVLLGRGESEVIVIEANSWDAIHSKVGAKSP